MRSCRLQKAQPLPAATSRAASRNCTAKPGLVWPASGQAMTRMPVPGLAFCSLRMVVVSQSR
jgi:hypothetical protein